MFTPQNTAAPEKLDIIPWHDHFNTGIPSIDEQHQQLVKLLNQLSLYLLYPDQVLHLEPIFNQLTEYALFHFQEEEAIWTQVFGNDTWLSEHQVIHNQFIDKIKALRNQHATCSDAEEIQEIVAFLTHWLAFHILETDRRMASVVLTVEQGLSLTEAKQLSQQEQDDANDVLIKGVLDMYQQLSARSLELLRENQRRQQAETRLRLAGSALESTLEGIVITDAELNIVNVNSAFCHAMQQTHERLMGVALDSIKPALTPSPRSELIWAMVRDSGHWSGELWRPDSDEATSPEWLTLSAIRSNGGDIEHYIAIFSDISALIERQQALESIANHDPLTGLPNRRLLADRIQQAIHYAQRHNSLLALCYLDLDGFKPINDLFGHAAGDILLRTVAQRLQASVRGHDTVARVGGDEFVMVFQDIAEPEHLKPLLERILQAIQEPVMIDDKEARVGASLGLSFYPLDTQSQDVLSEYADQALYQAKEAGKGCYRFYQHSR
ncbi:MAG: diguanylate cyclase [Methylococcales bacterium]|nr:diguanylate cyclase [Methylococcales bacterium]